MKIYCMSDIHGFLAEFEEALSLVIEHLEDEEDTMLLLMGDYIHGGPDNTGVLDKILSLQRRFGQDKVMALMGNHEEFVLRGDSSINNMNGRSYDDGLDEEDEDKYIDWLQNLPRYFTAGNTIFVHAGIDEDTGSDWEWETLEDIFTEKFPAETGKIEGLDMKVVAGHVHTSEICEDRGYNDIYYDGQSHYYIDGDVMHNGVVLVLMVDTKTDRYYRVMETGNQLILPYDEED